MKNFNSILSILLVLFLVFGLSIVALAQEDNDKTKITIAGGSVGIELELTKKAARMFEEEHPDVKVDVFQVDVIWPGELSDHFLDLNEYGAQEVADKHFDSTIQNNTVDGRLVAMPWYTDAGLLYYRTDLLEKYGYSEPPATWTELEEMARTIQTGEREENPDFWGYVWQGNAYEGLTCDALEWIHSNGGGRIINEDKEVTINNENAIEMVDMAASWVG